MNDQKQLVSIAIETSCRQGAVALGLGSELCDARSMGTTRKHAAMLLPTIDALLQEASLRPEDVDELYISVGPGSFTGLRVGITVARTWGQTNEHLRIVAVPTALAVADNVPGPWEHLGVLLAAKRSGEAAGTVCGTLLKPGPHGEAMFDGEPRVATPQELLADWPRPLVLTGEGANFCNWPDEPDMHLLDEAYRLPQAESVWRVGRRLAQADQFTPWPQLQVVYARKPEAVRLWEKRHGPDDENP